MGNRMQWEKLSIKPSDMIIQTESNATISVIVCAESIILAEILMLPE